MPKTGLIAWFWAFFLTLLLSNCAPTLSTPFKLAEETAAPRSAPAPRIAGTPRPPGCSDYSGYLPDPDHLEQMPIKYIRVNFHIMNKRDSSANFKPDAARRYFKELLRLANEELATNETNWRSPEGTPALPKQYRYILAPQPGDDGFYFHFDDEDYAFVSMGKNQNNFSTKVTEKYAIGKDSILNCFVQVHPPDSVKSKTYRANGQGIALGLSLKMAGLYETNIDPEGFDGLMNHEIGHILTLPHAWMEDGCPDTQNHPNKCFVKTETGLCDSMCTNNMMDYNMYQIALTPCQIGKIQANFANEKSRVRKCLVPNWCELHSDREVVIRDSTTWTGARDLEGNLTIADGGVLTINCRVSIPHKGQITVKPGGKLIMNNSRLHNACQKTWKGIVVQEKKGLKGEVESSGSVLIENVSE